MPDQSNPFLIPPPPPGMPVVPGVQPPSPGRPDSSPQVGAPPVGVSTSSTSKLPPSTGPASPSGIIFFPSTPGAPPSAGAAWHLVLPDGSDLPIVKAVFIGRDPARTPDRPGADVRPIDDPARSLSKTHALLELDAGSLWVHDLNSTNGVVVAAPGSDPIIVQSGVRAVLTPDAEVRLGSYVMRVQRT